jgi:WD40 repeat protein
MDPERWRVVSDLFLAALERELPDRVRFVRAAAGVDDELARDVEVLLASNEMAGAFMEVSALQAADAPASASSYAETIAPEDGGATRRFGDYELLGEIARGGMGIVFRARQVSLNRPVALKTVVGGALASPLSVQRFHAEAEAAANLAHPNIVPIYEIGEHDGQHYFSMRLLEGGSLEQKISDHALPAPGRGAAALSRTAIAAKQAHIGRLMATVARAVHHAHQRGVLHRDLKPANILLDAAGDPQVTDFGIAKLLARDGTSTLSLTVLGTPGYMAPEQAAGGTQLTTAADVFGLGAILYRLLTSHAPFEAATPMATLQQVIERDPAAPRSCNASIDRDLETICLKCLNKDPQRRYPSAEALAEDLERWLAGVPVTARPVTRAERTWRWCRRKPLLAALWFGLAATILAGFIVSNAQWRRAERNAVTLRENLYAADMGVAFHAWDAGNIARTRELLARHVPKAGEPDLRTFEWRYLWGVARPRELLTIRSDSAQIWGSATSPDGRLLATGGGDGRIQLWSLPSGGLAATLQAPDARNIVYGVAFSPDGRLLATTANSPVVHLWDVEGRRLLATLGKQKGNVLWVAFSHDGKTLASVAGWPYALDTPAEVTLWDVASHRKLAALVGHTSSSCRPDFSPDDRLLATPHGNGTILLWDLGSRTIVGTLAGHQGLVISVRFSPDGQLVASSGIDGTVRLWRVPSRRAVVTLGSHQGAVYSIAFSPDGTRLISGGLDHTARLWDIQRRSAVTTFRGHLSRIFSVSYAPDGKTVVTASLDGTARTWDATAPADTGIFDRHSGAIAYLRFSPDGRLLARSALWSSQVTLWDARSWKKLAVIPHANAGFSTKGALLATTSPPDVLAFWDVSQGVPTPRMTVALPSILPTPPALAPVFSPDGGLVAVGYGPPSAAVGIWDVEGRASVARLEPGAERVRPGAYAFSPDGRSLAIGYEGGRVHLWNAATWVQSGVLDGHSGRIEAVAFSPDGRFLATGSEDTTVRLWSTSPGSDPVVFRGDAGAVHSIAFSPEGHTLAVGSADGVVKFWNIRALREVATLKAHGTMVSSLAFAPDGRTLATVSADETMRLWRAPGFAEIDR